MRSLVKSLKMCVAIILNNNLCCLFHSVEITLPDAVNVITLKVANCDLHALGINLGLDRIKVQDIVSCYQLDERRQRLMELWFISQGLGDEPPTWERLREALPSCEHSGGSGGSTGTRNTERCIIITQ